MFHLRLMLLLFLFQFVLHVASQKKTKRVDKTIDPRGKTRLNFKKLNKIDKPKNPNVVRWKGKTIITHGTSADDIPETIHKVSEDLKKIPKYGKSCNIKEIKSASAINAGPKADGVLQSDFQPCLERRRGAKTKHNKADKGKGKGKGKGGAKTRHRRSESFAAVNWLWSDPENIPLVYDNSFPTEFKSTVTKATEMWENYTCVRFLESTAPPEQPNASYVLLTTGGGTCTTDRLGPNWYSPYTTKIDASLCYNTTGILSHEIGHAIGLAHSQKRVDRDNFVNLYMQNIDAAWAPQYDKDDPKYFTDWGVPFYYDSIMEYFPYAATSNKLMTMCPLDPLMEIIMGQREEPAFGDISLVNKMYCQESCFNRSDLKNPFSGSLSMTISGRTCQNWGTQTPHQHTYGNIGNHTYCRNPDGWEGGPWCYTNEPTVVYEPCFSACEDLAATKKPYCEGWCYNGGYHDPNSCACLCPSYASGKFCEITRDALKYSHLTCGGRIGLGSVGSSYVITSPNYPSNYSVNTVCMWWILGPINSKIQLTFNDFAIETADKTGCYDFLEIRQSLCATAQALPDKLRYCGDSLTPDANGVLNQILSDDNNLVLKFVTDEVDNSRGFNVTATIVGGSTL